MKDKNRFDLHEDIPYEHHLSHYTIADGIIQGPIVVLLWFT